MSAANLLKYAYLSYFAKPAWERLIYRTIRKQRVSSIVELGIGTALRTTRMIEVAQRYCRDEVIQYAGVDLFESRPADAVGLSFKRAHQVLKPTGARVRLVPGDPHTALARVANDLTGTDLLLISADQDSDALEQAWFYIPRMLHERSVVFHEQAGNDGESVLTLLRCEQLESLARDSSRRARRAA